MTQSRAFTRLHRCTKSLAHFRAETLSSEHVAHHLNSIAIFCCSTGWCRVGWLVPIIILACWVPEVSFAEGSVPHTVEKDPAMVQGPELPGTVREQASQSRHSETASSSISEVPQFSFTWETRPGRSYLIPALEIPAYLFLLNLYDRHYTEPKELYRTDGNSFWKNLTDS